MRLDQFFITDTTGFSVVNGSYNYLFVFLSVFLAASACFIALRMAEQSREFVVKKYRTIALASGALIMAGGIWSMHFVGMLAFYMPHEMTYKPSVTVLSIFPAILASYILLTRLVNKADSYRLIFMNAVVVGGGIGAMHYIGMAAMEMPMILRYDPYWFVASILVAVALACIALIARRSLTTVFPSLTGPVVGMVSATIMGLAISGMHYTGMEAAVFITSEHQHPSAEMVKHNDSLAFAVTVFTLLVSILALNVNAQFRSHHLVLEKTASEARLQAILDTAIDGVITINSTGIIQAYNTAASTIFGWQEAEVLGRNISMLMPPPHEEAHDTYLQNYMTTGKASIIGSSREVFALHKDGHQIPVRLGVGRIDLNSEEVLFVGFVSDISVRREMEEELRKSEERLSSLVRNIPGASFRCLLDEHWTPLFLTDAIEEISGYTAADYLSGKRSFGDWLHPEDDARIRAELNAAMGTHDTYALEYRVLHRDSHIVWVLEKGTFIYDEAGQAIRIDGVMLDISDRKAMEDELRDAKTRAEASAESKASFLANMSHEIRTPMNSIIGFSNMLLEETWPAKSEKQLLTINQAAYSLLHLLNDILDSAKLENRKLELELMPFNLTNCVDQVVSTLWLQAKNKDLALKLAVDENLSEVFLGAEERIRQVLMNLVGNGIKFTHQGSVTLSVKPEKGCTGWVRFEISDTGIGIAPDRLEAIFDPFTQADASMSRRFGGTGLGVTISKQLVELMGGEIGVSSEEGAGSCFYFTIPLQTSDKTIEVASNDVLVLPPLRVLVADDIEQNLSLLELFLERQGHFVIIAQNGLEAVRLFREMTPDIVLMDIQMPEMDGLEASRSIRNYERSKHLPSTPIIALTASVLPRDRLQAHEAGMDGFANKPVDFAQLTTIMADVLKLDTALLSHDRKDIGFPRQGASKAINLSKGIDLWGDQQLYLSELLKFADQNNNLVSEMTRALKDGERKDLDRKVHTLKGLSGNLALIPLSQAFAELEKVLRDGDEQSESALMDALTLEWENFRSELFEMGAPHSVQGEAVEGTLSINAATLSETLHSWLEASEAGEMREDLALKLLASIVPETIQPHLQKASDAMDEFEFPRAIEHIRAAINLVEGEN